MASFFWKRLQLKIPISNITKTHQSNSFFSPSLVGCIMIFNVYFHTLKNCTAENSTSVYFHLYNLNFGMWDIFNWPDNNSCSLDVTCFKLRTIQNLQFLRCCQMKKVLFTLWVSGNCCLLAHIISCPFLSLYIEISF